MAAGGSALRRSRELEEDAEALFSLSELKREEARRYLRASASEAELGGVLAPLAELGWHVLEDRQWPGSRRANVDFLLVGPGGVVVLDAKDWAELSLRDGALHRGEAREDEEVAKLRALCDTLGEHLAPTGVTRAAVRAAMVFTRHAVSAEVDGVAALGPRDVAGWLARLPLRVEDSRVAEVLAAVEEASPPMPAAPPASARVGASTRRGAAAAEVPVAQEPLEGLEDLTEALVERALDGPLEDWMTFLHPAQNRLVQVGWTGPGRVRGPAGTGKTVVALHRAVHLAERHDEPVLFVSFVKTLPQVFEGLAERLRPGIGENIEFTGVHALAYRVLQDLGGQPAPDPRRAFAAFRRAWRACPQQEVLHGIDPRPTYWQEEIDHIIKPRRLADLDAYRELRRHGRVTPLRGAGREAAWELYLAYEAELAQAGVQDFNDLLLQAGDAVERFPEAFGYAAVVVDEVQDLNLAGLRLLAALAEGTPGSLLLVGDGRQSVYPGGFSLAEAGVSVAGRGAVLSTNYRNTRQVLACAQSVLGDHDVEDLGEAPASHEVEVLRTGPAPLVVQGAGRDDVDAALISLLRTSHERDPRGWDRYAVLTERSADAERITRLLREHDVPSLQLTSYRGVPSDKVKVGTIKRAKGLEFPYVLLPYLSLTPPARGDGEPEESHTERVDRWRREMYVGMTRARDGLWLGYVEG
ncbi:nuclease-related domain-containing DEAD/DEAH box helicase [Nocardioides bruguierae]|uniref:nuclease-related domain-containing DEAD/DEAH box helicase n=1 Tax=Nocardioides bruguierae TaxID=2945102 RepID=UPI00202296A3|nr:UvrD-helicase domain-containing protein [Nocardioides bruguierae]MCL8025038.1 AAA family ATPase [Nocardioides bruguierae]